MKGTDQREQVEILYGRQPVREMLRAGRRRCFGLWVAGGVKATKELDEIRDLAKAADVRIQVGDPKGFSAVAPGLHHQGVMARVSAYPYVGFKEVRLHLSKRAIAPVVVVLDHLQDPQNLGSILRTAEAAGAGAVMIPSDRAVAVTPAAVRASSGASEHMTITRVTNLVRAMKQLQEDGLWFSGLEDVPEASTLSEADLTGPLGLVIGAEGRGLGRLVRETCDFLIRLPMYGNVSSLNAGVAAGIALYEALRQKAAAEASPASGGSPASPQTP